MTSLLEDSDAHIPSPPPPKPQAIQPSPIQSFQLRQAVAGIETELLIQTFDDRILVIITQNGKVGCLTQASIPPHTPLPHPRRLTPPPDSNNTTATVSPLSLLPPPPPSLQLTPLLGTPPSQILYNLYTSQIATIIWWTLQSAGVGRRNVVVGLALTLGVGKSSGGRVQEDGSGEDGEEHDSREKERERMLGIIEMVSRWDGPDVESQDD